MVQSTAVYSTILIILISLHGALSQSRLQAQAIIDKNSLNHGENCNYETEEQRQKILNPLLKDIHKLSLNQIFALPGEMSKAIDEVSHLPGKFCDLFKHLACTPSGVCDCSSASEGSLSRQNFEYKDGQCMLSLGSVCTPADESTTQVNVLFQTKKPEDVFCSTGTKCIVKESGMNCTVSKIKEELEMRTKKALESGNLSPQDEIELTIKQGYKLLSEEFCVCSGATFYISSILILFSLLTKLFI